MEAWICAVLGTCENTRSLEVLLTSTVVAAFGAAMIAGSGRLIYDILKRRSRERDIVRAIYAEITASRATVVKQLSPAQKSYVLNDEFPYAPADRTDFVFEQIRPDVTLVPSDLIGVVVLYYKLTMQTNALIEAMAEDAYKQQDRSERLKYRESLLAVLDNQVEAADAAITEIKDYAKRKGFNLPNLTKKSIEKSDSAERHSPNKVDEGDNGTSHGSHAPASD